MLTAKIRPPNGIKRFGFYQRRGQHAGTLGMLQELSWYLRRLQPDVYVGPRMLSVAGAIGAS